jgi:hypothetical protein
MSVKIEDILIEAVNARKIPDEEMYKIIEEVQKKQEEILARKYVNENELRKHYITI